MMTRKRMSLVSLFAALLVLAAWVAIGQDAVKTAPKNFKVLLDNDEVRVMEYTSKAGEKVVLHSHPPNVVYALADGKTKFTMPDGSTKVLTLKKGEAIWSAGGPHSTETITDTHVIQIELKKAK